MDLLCAFVPWCFKFMHNAHGQVCALTLPRSGRGYSMTASPNLPGGAAFSITANRAEGDTGLVRLAAAF
jgi:hypothetical protein